MSVKTTKAPVAKPILKWAGGKTQMLGELMPRVPKTYGRYCFVVLKVTKLSV